MQSQLFPKETPPPAPKKLPAGRPMFSYFGSKWRGSKRFGAPREPLVIEPFAGSACYSLRYRAPRVKLYDKYEVICAVWHWLIHCSEEDIKRIPDYFPDKESIVALPSGARDLVTFWIGYASTDIGRMSMVTYHKYADRHDCSVWGAAVKARIIEQKPIIADWTIDCLSYEQIPNQRAHWHIDPPYNNDAGKRYIHGCADIDYDDLGKWCLERQGVVQVAEQQGADWLPFGSPYETRSASCTGKPSKEVIFECTNLGEGN